MAESKKEEKALKRVQEEIKKIENKKSKVFFFVLDTKGNPSGSLEYIYKLAMIAKNDGYDVGMLYQSIDKSDKFVGVKDWLGQDYANIPHYDISNNDVEISPSDILFIPEIFSNVMNQTKKLPCKRIAIFQNYDYMVEQMPFSAQWGDFGIIDAITNTENNATLLKDVFPYVKCRVITPYVDKMFGTTISPKKMIVNIVASNQEDINKIIKPFYWKYPSFKWVSFRDLRGFPKEQFAESLRDAAITIWVDEKTSFGYSALEAMRCRSILLAKLPDTLSDWNVETDKEGNSVITDACLWFEHIDEVPDMLAKIVRSWTLDNIPQSIYDGLEKFDDFYTKEAQEKEIERVYVKELFEKRISDFKEVLAQLKNNNEEEKAE